MASQHEFECSASTQAASSFHSERGRPKYRFCQDPVQKRTPRIRASIWEHYKSEILCEYDLGGLTHVIDYMKTEHCFDATRNQFKYLIHKRWKHTSSGQSGFTSSEHSSVHGRSACAASIVRSVSVSRKRSSSAGSNNTYCPEKRTRMDCSCEIMTDSSSGGYNSHEDQLDIGSYDRRSRMFLRNPARRSQSEPPDRRLPSSSCKSRKIITPVMKIVREVMISVKADDDWQKTADGLRLDCDRLAWDEILELRDTAEVFLACSALRVAFILHYMVYCGMTLFPGHHQYKVLQLAYCSRSAVSDSALRAVQYLLENVCASQKSITRHNDVLVHMCLAEMYSRQGQEMIAKAEEQLRLAWSYKAKHEEPTCDIFLHSRTSLASTLANLRQLRTRTEVTTKPQESLIFEEDPRFSFRMVKLQQPMTYRSAFVLYSWCRERMLRADSRSFQRFAPKMDSARYERSEIMYLNTLSLFTFLWLRRDLISFRKTISKPKTVPGSRDMPDWAKELREHIGTSLADMIWAIAKLISRRFILYGTYIMRSELCDESHRVIRELDCLSEDDMHELLGRELAELKSTAHDRQSTVDESWHRRLLPAITKVVLSAQVQSKQTHVRPVPEKLHTWISGAAVYPYNTPLTGLLDMSTSESAIASFELHCSRRVNYIAGRFGRSIWETQSATSAGASSYFAVSTVSGSSSGTKSIASSVLGLVDWSHTS